MGSLNAPELIRVAIDPAYDVIVGDGLLASLGELVRGRLGGRTCAVVSDATVAAHFAQTAMESLRASGFQPVLVTVPAGEKSKSLEQVGFVAEAMARGGLDRSSFLVALGGGVVGDLAGFVAATYHRGIPYVQVPTTLLAQVDSSIGGKTAVNTASGKNLLGSVHQPSLVVSDVDTLRTLPEATLHEGFAEIIKHAIIRDAEMLSELAQIDRKNLTPLIQRNVRIKAEIVAHDEHETSGERALLNFGHTIGHAIERAAGYGVVLHGEAVSLGIVAACAVSMERAGLSRAERDLVIARLEQFGLPVKLPPDISRAAVFDALRFDKKFTDGQVRFVVTPRLGSAHLASDVTLDDLQKAITEL